MRICCVLGLLLLALSSGSGAQPVNQPPVSFPAVDAADTVRTNIWLAQALLGDVVREAAMALPPPPAGIELHDLGRDDSHALFTTIAAEILGAQGYTLYLPDTANQRAVTDSSQVAVPESDAAAMAFSDVGPKFEFRYQLEEIGLEYPESGRTFGIWRRWVGRELFLVAIISIVEKESGRLLLSDRIRRTYGDRVPASSFERVRSDVYPFTDAELQESGWHRRLEEFVVLGTLAGLVAIYFANTGD